MEEEKKGLQTIAEQVDTSICELTTAELTPVLFQRNRDTDSLCPRAVGQLMCDFVRSLTVDELKALWGHQSQDDRQFILVRLSV